MRSLLALSLSLASFSLCAPLAAQATACHGNNDNLSFENGSSMGGPGLSLGMKTTAPANYVATRIEVFTGEQQGVNAVALWSHDAVNNRPLAPLASGNWTMSRVNTWQGANLSVPVPITAGQDLWVVWSPINGAQSSLQASGTGTNVAYRGSFDGGASWNGPFNGPWKFRIWCGPLGAIEQYGVGCVGTSGRAPEMAWFGLPQVGATLNVHLERGRAASAALLAFGDSDTSHLGNPLPFSLASFGAPGCNVLCSIGSTVFTPTDAVTGQAVLPVAVPAAPGLIGTPFFTQWFVLDTANALGLTTSSAARAIVGA